MTAVGSAPSVEQATTFLEAIFAGKPGGHRIGIGLIEPHAGHDAVPRTTWFFDPAAAARFAVDQADEWDVYVSPTTVARPPGGNRRVSGAIAAGLGGFYGDWDLAGPGHAQTKLPAGPDDVRALLAEAFPDTPPSLLVASGGGVHAYHLFREFWVFADAAERSRAQAQLAAYQATVRAKAGARGWYFEKTSDLARLLRVPGTRNHKLDAPRPVELLRWTR